MTIFKMIQVILENIPREGADAKTLHQQVTKGTMITIDQYHSVMETLAQMNVITWQDYMVRRSIGYSITMEALKAELEKESL